MDPLNLNQVICEALIETLNSTRTQNHVTQQPRLLDNYIPRNFTSQSPLPSRMSSSQYNYVPNPRLPPPSPNQVWNYYQYRCPPPPIINLVREYFTQNFHNRNVG